MDIIAIVRRPALGVLVLSLALGLGSVGCEAYNKVAYAALDNMKASSGSVRVVNTMSVPVCQVSMIHEADENRAENDLQGKLLAPGAEGTVDVPYVGKASEQKPQPEVWTMKVYGCKDRTAYEKEAGSLLATIPDVRKDGKDPIAIR